MMCMKTVENRPFVTIDLEPALQDFLFHEFGQTKNKDGVVISCTHDIGKMIQSMVTITDKPRKQELGDHPINIYVPIQSWNHSIFRENFIYIPEWKQVQLRMYIEAYFKMKVQAYFQAGHEKGYRQDHIIEGFLAAYNIKNCVFTFAQLKQMDYRYRRRIIKEVSEDIKSAIVE